MKILHCSDIHLGKKPFGTREFTQERYLDFFRVFDELITKAIEIKIDLLIIAGDLFDKKELTPDVLNRTENIFYKLKYNNIPVFLIEGNHDNIQGNDTINSWLNYLETKGYVKRGNYSYFEKEYKFSNHKFGDINVYGVGYPGFAIDDVLKSLANQLNPKEKNIVVVHTALGGGEFLPGLVSSDTIKLFKDKVVYIAGGHLHSFQVYPKENPYFFIPGSLEYWNVLNERKKEKGAILFDTDTTEYQFIQVNPRKRIEITIDYCENFEEDFLNKIEKLQLEKQELVIVNIKLSNSIFLEVDKLEKLLEEKGAFRGYVRLVYENSKYDLENNEYFYSIQEAEKNIISSWNEFSNPDNVVKYLQKFKEYQEEGSNSSDFITLFDKMLEEEIKDENQ